jgi:hypothetical protein
MSEVKVVTSSTQLRLLTVSEYHLMVETNQEPTRNPSNGGIPALLSKLTGIPCGCLVHVLHLGRVLYLGFPQVEHLAETHVPALFARHRQIKNNYLIS